MRTRIFNGKEQIFCDWRRRWVRLTPEEWVRQQLLHRMVDQLGYPASRIAVEQAITVGEVSKRCDAVVYQVSVESQYLSNLSPLLLIECKAETVPLTQKTLDQALTYNRRLQVPYLLLHNGPQSLFVTLADGAPPAVNTTIPAYNQL